VSSSPDSQSFFATLEGELLDRTVFENGNVARMAIFELPRGVL
jgi:hypothetical protein